MAHRPGGLGHSGRESGQLEYRMAGCLLYELLHRVVGLGVEEWGGYPCLAKVALEHGTGCSWIDLLCMERLRPSTMAKGDLGLGTDVMNPCHHSVGPHKPALSIASTRMTGVVLCCPLLRPVVVRR